MSRLPQLVYETKKDLKEANIKSTIVGHVGDVRSSVTSANVTNDIGYREISMRYFYSEMMMSWKKSGKRYIESLRGPLPWTEHVGVDLFCIDVFPH